VRRESIGGASPPQTVTEPVELHLPPVFAVSSAVLVGRTILAGELARLGYGGVFGEVVPPS
jgi:hypothetical protein